MRMIAIASLVCLLGAEIGGCRRTVVVEDSSGSDESLGTPASPSTPGNLVGINIGPPIYYDPTLPYADAAKQGNYGTTVSVDSNGWPTVPSFTQRLWTAVRGTQGTYTVYFDGTASVVVNGVASYTQPSGSGTTKSFTFTIASTEETFPTISFTNAHRPDGSNGLVNIKVMRPAAQGSHTSQPPNAMMSAALKQFVKRGFKVMRFMDFQATNWNVITTWGGAPWKPGHPYKVGDVVTMKISGDQAAYGNGRVYRCTVAGTSNSNPSGGPNTATWGRTVTDGVLTWQHIGWGRPLPTWASFDNNAGTNSGWNPAAGATFGWQGMGGPLEHIIAFANELAAEGYPIDVWVMIPHAADDDYLTKMAQVFAFGSDGAMPYTSPQPNPVYPPLNPNSNIYVEYSNEIWGGVTFTTGQTAYVNNTAAADGVLNYDGDTSNLRYRYVARQTVKAANAFRAAFGDAAMAAGRVRPVIMGQLGWWDVSTAPALKFIHEYYGNGDGKAHVPNPHPVSWYVWGTGGAPYLVPTDTSTVAGMLSTGAMTTSALRNAITGQARLAAAFGVKLIAYEGGPEFPSSVIAAQANMTDRPGTLGAMLTGTPNMRDTLIGLHNQWTALGGDLWAYFNAASSGNGRAVRDWTFAGQLTTVASTADMWLSSPKLGAIAELAATAPAAPTIGSAGLPPPAYAIPADTTGISAPGGGYAILWPDATYTMTGSGSGTLVMSPTRNNLAGWIFLASETGTRSVSIVLTGVAAGAQALLYWNNGLIGETTAGADGTFTFGGVPVRAGLNGLLVNAKIGSFTIDSISVQ
jgi:hypothetical protein